MNLLTPELQSQIPTINKTDHLAPNDKKLICKFFNPCGDGSWYVIEGEKDGDDYIFYGLVDLYEREFGYFTLNELKSITLSFGLQIERDLHFLPCKVGEI